MQGKDGWIEGRCGTHCAELFGGCRGIESLMYRGLLHRKKALIGAATAAVATVGLLTKSNGTEGNGKAFVNRIHLLRRNTRTIITASKILNNYWWAARRGSNEWNRLHQYAADNLLELFQKNGGIYIKFGQHLASIDYLIPGEFCETMKKLFQEAAISPISHVDAVIERELGRKKEEIFVEFCEVPIGAASLAQVHEAVLRDTGERVAVKVQHLKLREFAQNDIRISAFLFGKIRYFFPGFEFDWLRREMQLSIPREMDFIQEAENSVKMQAFVEGDAELRNRVKIPKVYPELSTSCLLVMQMAKGIGVTDVEAMKRHGIAPNALCKLISQLFCKMIFDFRLLHCDPHPGNMLIEPGDGNGEEWKLVLLDHGLYREIPKSLVEEYATLWKSLLFFNENSLKQVCKALGISSENYRTLSSILSQSTWSFLSSRNILIHKQQRNIQEFQRKSIQNFASIMQVLSCVPRELLLIFKTNDILRSLERKITGSYVQKHYLRATLSHSLAYLWHQHLGLWQRFVLAFQIGIFRLGCLLL